jgi:hypothetical protein
VRGRESDSGAIGAGRRWFHVEHGVRMEGCLSPRGRRASALRRRVLPGPPAYRFILATLRSLLARTVSLLAHMEENDRGVAIGMRGSLRTPARDGSRRAVLHGQALRARPLKDPVAARSRHVDLTTGPRLAGPSLERPFESPTRS